ncbi:hypothetical protein JOD67_002457 [Tenggerimyces flavus]|nr:hypothetical protein [Tenggerimyces flavus]
MIDLAAARHRPTIARWTGFPLPPRAALWRTASRRFS